MGKIWTFAALLGALGTTSLAPAPAAAQDRSGDGWWSWALPAVMDGAPLKTSRGELRLPRGERDAADRTPGAAARGEGRGQAASASGRDKRRGQGPPFCRDGRGHPVHGLDWCRDKGWDDDGRLWQRASWPDVIFGRREPESRALDRRSLADVLGEIVLGRVDERSRYLGLADALVGRWVAVDGGGSVLQVKSGDVPVAELTDADGDGRVDGTILLEAL